MSFLALIGSPNKPLRLDALPLLVCLLEVVQSLLSMLLLLP
jgi:hypothetical protein